MEFKSKFLRFNIGAEKKRETYGDLMKDLGYGRFARSKSGTDVSPSSVSGIPAFFMALRMISETIASLPYSVIDVDTNEELIKSHPFRRLVDRPNAIRSRNAWIRMVMLHLIMFGNSVHHRIYGNGGTTIGLQPLPPPPITYLRRSNDNADPNLLESYRVISGTFNEPLDECLWFSGTGYDGIVGSVPILQFKDSFGLMQAILNYSSDFFEHANIPWSILSAPPGTTEEEMLSARAQWEQMKFRQASGEHGTAVLRGGDAGTKRGYEFQALGYDPEQSQLLESREFNTLEAARMAKIQQTKIGVNENATYTNQHEENLAYKRDTIDPWLAVLEDGFSRLAQEYVGTELGRGNNFEVKFDSSSLIERDFGERMGAYKIAIDAGIMPYPEEVRAREGLPPLDEVRKELGIPEDEPEPTVVVTDEPDDDEREEVE